MTMTMVGAQIKLTESYLIDLRRDYLFRKHMSFFESTHTVTSRNHRLIFINTPFGPWSLVRGKYILIKKAEESVCKCSWKHCRNKVVS